MPDRLPRTVIARHASRPATHKGPPVRMNIENARVSSSDRGCAVDVNVCLHRRRQRMCQSTFPPCAHSSAFVARPLPAPLLPSSWRHRSRLRRRHAVRHRRTRVGRAAGTDRRHHRRLRRRLRPWWGSRRRCSGRPVQLGRHATRPDAALRAQGVMPTYADLMRTGATGDNGLTQGFPPNTGQGWYTMATGAWPGVHGSTNNTFFDNRQPFTSRPRSPSTATARARAPIRPTCWRPSRSPRRPSWPARRSPSWSGPAG